MTEDDSQRVSQAAAGALTPAATTEPAEADATPEPSPETPTVMTPPSAASTVPQPTPALPERVIDEPPPPRRAVWLGRAGALGLLGVVPHSVSAFDEFTGTGWNAFAVLSPIEGILAALAVFLLVQSIGSGRVPTSVGAGALLVVGAATTVSALGLTAYSAAWVPSATAFALVVLAGGVLTLAAGVDCLRAARPAAAPRPVGAEPLVLGGAGLVAAFLGLFLKYDGESSLVSELEASVEYFYTAAFPCVLALGGLLALRGAPRAAAGALLASGAVVATHYLGVMLASAAEIGEPGETRIGGFVGILGGLLLAAAGAYAYAATRPVAAGPA